MRVFVSVVFVVSLFCSRILVFVVELTEVVVVISFCSFENL